MMTVTIKKNRYNINQAVFIVNPTRESCSFLFASSSFCFSRLWASLILRCSSSLRSSSSFLSLSA